MSEEYRKEGEAYWAVILRFNLWFHKRLVVGNRKNTPKKYKKINADSPTSLWQKEGRRICKEKEPSRQKNESRSFSAMTGEVKRLKYFLQLVEGSRIRFYAAGWLTFPQAATVSVTSNSRLKTPNNGLIKPKLGHKIMDSLNQK